MSTETELRSYRSQVSRHRADIGTRSKTVASKRKKAADAEATAAKTKSDATRRAKLREAESATKEANSAESKRAESERKLAAVEKKVFELQAKLEKEQRTRYDKSLQSLQRAAQSASRQFTPPSRIDPAPLVQGQALVVAQPVYDVFLSHASEDKNEIARPLMTALEGRGLTVWFDELKIKVGQSIRQEIEKGIAGARFGVVVLSPSFFSKQWTQAELDALFSKKFDTGRSMILPVWHRVTKDEVASHSPLLAGVLALNSATMTLDEIADAIAEAVQGDGR